MKKVNDIEFLSVYGAKENNLKNITTHLPRGRLIVITGISGSGKSSLAFDTIYKEGQRRYMESFPSYIRTFLGKIERPEVDKIDGLSPVISIEQKTISRNPRSTIGTVTEVYDFLRLLFSKVSKAYSYITNKEMVSYTQEEIKDLIMKEYDNKTIKLLSPLVRGRKGNYRELFKQLLKWGFTKVRIDGTIQTLDIDYKKLPSLERYKIHDIQVIVDELKIGKTKANRLLRSIETTLKYGKGTIMLIHEEEDASTEIRYLSSSLTCHDSGIAYDEPNSSFFSFNSPYGYCNTCKGTGEIEPIAEAITINENLSLTEGVISFLEKLPQPYTNLKTHITKLIEGALQSHKIKLDTPVKDINKEVLYLILYGDKSTDKKGISENIISDNGIKGMLEDIISSSVLANNNWRKNKVCPSCKGGRIRKEALFFRLNGKNIIELSQLSIEELEKWFYDIESKLSKHQISIGHEIIKEIRKRIAFLNTIGLEYLSLDRSIRTISGGEAQRIRLARQLSTELIGILYVLDEPSIGLHPRDNYRLIESLKRLKELGNSVIVIEHDRDIMLESDYIVDLGPSAGSGGGTIVAEGTLQQIKKTNSLTAKFLNNSSVIDYSFPRKRPKNFITLKGAKGNNLKNVDIKIPLQIMTCITGVSGSGKSSIIQQTLVPVLKNHFLKPKIAHLPYNCIENIELLNKLIEIDQSPIGRTSRSNPATYIGFFKEIRSLFASLKESKIRGYSPTHFSFNTKGGRCEKCKGKGIETIEMFYLPEVQVECDLCRRKRYAKEVLKIEFKNKNIYDVLEMSIKEATLFFNNQPTIYDKIKTLEEVGLGYLKVGHFATDLSGGEAQRVKIAKELAKKDTQKTIYILDEPTTGLHFQDIKLLLKVLKKLVDKGNTVLIIEHNMDVIKSSDYIIDMGPEGGEKGGNIIAEGTPEDILSRNIGYTSKFLEQYLSNS